MTNPYYDSIHHHRRIQFAMTDRFSAMSADYADCIGRDEIALKIMSEERDAVFEIWSVARSLANQGG